MNNFYDEQKAQSNIKTKIVTDYFDVWFNILKKHADRLFYADFFCGPGTFKNGSKSTPIIILEKVVANEDMCTKVVTFFNDKNPKYIGELKKQIKQINNIEELKYRPIIENTEINSDISKRFTNTDLIPTFSFLDPWGYKGLSLKLVKSLIKDWGSECILFFNYNRISVAIKNKTVENHIISIFGKENFIKISEEYDGLSPHNRECQIVKIFTDALRNHGGEYVLPFRFQLESQDRTSHYLFYVTKHPLGYKIMKDIMAKYSTNCPQGVPSYEFNPNLAQQPYLPNIETPLDDLSEQLLDKFSGETLSMREIFNKHHVNKRYRKKNYKDALCKLELDGRIKGTPPITERKKISNKPTCSDFVIFEFPKG